MLQGRATHYGADQRLEAAHVACGEPQAQFGVIEHGSCGYTNSDGSLPFPREMYAAAADTNEDFPGSCGRCYEVRQFAIMRKAIP
jgi:cullin-associated NEDD8-dissociated protein 1